MVNSCVCDVIILYFIVVFEIVDEQERSEMAMTNVTLTVALARIFSGGLVSLALKVPFWHRQAGVQ